MRKRGRKKLLEVLEGEEEYKSKKMSRKKIFPILYFRHVSVSLNLRAEREKIVRGKGI